MDRTFTCVYCNATNFDSRHLRNFTSLKQSSYEGLIMQVPVYRQYILQVILTT